MDKTKMATRITVFCIVILITSLTTVYTCTTTEVKYAKRGEDVILQFQAVTTHPENSYLYVSNIVKSPNASTLLPVLYQDGSATTQSPTCNGCTFVGDTATGNISIRIDNLQTANAGTYRHSALGQVEDIKCITVYILDGPDSHTTTLSPARTVYTISEGAILPNITCVGDCFPACSYKWTTPGNKEVARGNILSLGTLTKEHATVYTCRVTNTQKDGFVDKTLTVNVIHISFFVNGSEGQNEITVDEYNDVQFTCLITSEWESTVRILFQDDTLKEQLQTNSLTFTRYSITCLHAGTYNCEGDDQHAKVPSAPIKLLVRCSPRPLRHANNTFTSSLYGSVTVSLTTLAYPEPGSSGFLWHKEDGIRWIALLSNTDLLISSSGLNSNLTIMNVSQQDFGQYRVTVTNDIGSYKYYLFLVEKGENKQQMTTDDCPLERDKTGLIVGISFGIVIAVLAVYSTCVTIALKRNRANKGTKLNEESTKQTTYINIAEGGTGRDTIGLGENKDNSIEMYTDLARSSLDEKTTYDVIQRA